MNTIDFSIFDFHPAIKMPRDYAVYDFTGKNKDEQNKSIYGVGRYNEKRPNMYEGEIYQDQRDIHMGIDLGAPVGTEVFAVYDAEIFLFQDNNRPLDYGPTIILKSILNGVELFILYGHLSRASLVGLKSGSIVKKADKIASIGDSSENGGWPPHLHFQLSFEEPKEADIPGVVSEADLERALKIYPDPSLVLGNLY